MVIHDIVCNQTICLYFDHGYCVKGTHKITPNKKTCESRIICERLRKG